MTAENPHREGTPEHVIFARIAGLKSAAESDRRMAGYSRERVADYEQAAVVKDKEAALYQEALDRLELK